MPHLCGAALGDGQTPDPSEARTLPGLRQTSRRFPAPAPSRGPPAAPARAVPHQIATIATMTKFSILLLAASAFAQKQPITLETLSTAGRGGGGRGGPGMAGTPTWMPDGKSFLFRQGRSLSLYDPVTKTSKLLIDTTPIDAAAVAVPPHDGPPPSSNNRPPPRGTQRPPRARRPPRGRPPRWRHRRRPPRGHAALRRRQVPPLYRRRRPLPHPYRLRQVGATHQNAGCRARRQALPRRPHGRFPPRLGPLYRGCRLRQGNAPHPRWHRHLAQRHPRLGLPRGIDPGHRFLVVAGFEIALLPAIRYQPRARLPPRRPARHPCLRRARTLSASRREQSRRPPGSDRRYRRSHQVARSRRHAQRLPHRPRRLDAQCALRVHPAPESRAE